MPLSAVWLFSCALLGGGVFEFVEAERAVLFAARAVSLGSDLSEQPLPAARTEARRIELPAAVTGALALWESAPRAEIGQFGSHQMTFDNAPIGIRRSSSIFKSCCGSRPSVVR